MGFQSGLILLLGVLLLNSGVCKEEAISKVQEKLVKHFYHFLLMIEKVFSIQFAIISSPNYFSSNTFRFEIEFFRFQ